MKQFPLFLIFALAPAAIAQPAPVFQDNVLDQMTGDWKLTGTIRGQKAEHAISVEWVLNHQFLKIHEIDTRDRSAANWYEALVLLGQDNVSERYVIHWNDVYGGRYSETLGYATRSGNRIEFLFEY